MLITRPLYLTTLFTLFITTAFSQTSTGNVEVATVKYAALRAKVSDVIMVPLGNNGLLAYYRDDATKDKNTDTWFFIKLDTMLHQEWTSTISHSNKSEYFGKALLHDNVLYLLYVPTNYKKTNFTLLIVDLLKNKTEELNDDFAKTITSKFMVAGDFAYFYALDKSGNALFRVNLKTKEKFIYPADDYGKDMSFEDMTKPDEAGNFKVTLSTNGKNPKYIIKTVNSLDNKTSDFAIDEVQEGKRLAVPVMAAMPNGSRIIAGNYEPLSSNKFINGGIKGIYVAKYEGDNGQFIKFYKYADIEHFIFDKWIGIKNDEDVYHVRFHPIITNGNNFNLVGEVYITYPHDMTMGNTTYREIITTPVNQGLLASFDYNGNKLWDNCFKIDALNTEIDTYKIMLNRTDNNTSIYYAMYDSINARNIIDNKVVIRSSKPIQALKNANGKKPDDTFALPWYGHNFIYWSSEKMKDKVVYYARKIGY